MQAAQQLDAIFAALADATRRAILARLAAGEASVNELAEPFEMSQPAVSKHLRVLERAGLISRSRDAQRRPCRLEAKPLAEADEWLERYREFLGGQLRAAGLVAGRNENATKIHGCEKAQEKEAMRNVGKMTIDAPGEREIVMTRVFDAPRQLVYEAFTKPELVSRWLTGPAGWTMPVCEIDLTVGGRYRYVWKNADGKQMSSHGVYQEIAPGERVVATEQFDDPWYPGQAVGTTTFVEVGGRTTVTMSVQYDSRETRDMVLKTGMETGVAYSFDQLEQILAETGADELMTTASMPDHAARLRSFEITADVVGRIRG